MDVDVSPERLDVELTLEESANTFWFIYCSRYKCLALSVVQLFYFCTSTFPKIMQTFT